MARLHLVRHAQASFGMDDYDNLSPLGIQQAAFIPLHFKSGIHSFYSGDMKRHRQTLEHSFNPVDVNINAGFNEFDHKNVLKVHMPEIDNREAVMELVSKQSNPKKFIESEFETAMMKWIFEEGTSSYNESFKHFANRATESLNLVIDESRKNNAKNVVVMSSGGVISFIVSHLLEMPLKKMIDLNLGIVNTSVTTLLFNKEKVSLSCFNNYSHLPQDMITRI
jgi:broad specificity phosphatase PhoE